MYCIKCGKKIKKDKSFCIHCGTRCIQENAVPSKTINDGKKDCIIEETVNIDSVTSEDKVNKIEKKNKKIFQGLKLFYNKKGENKRKGNTKNNYIVMTLIIILSILYILICVGLFFSIKKIGLFLPENKKVLLALNNSLKFNTGLLNSIKDVENLVSDDFTIYFDTDVPGMKVSDGKISSSVDKIQASATIDIKGTNVKKCTAELNDEQFKLYIPELDSYCCISYLYRNDPNAFDDPTWFSIHNDESIGTLLQNINQVNHKNQVMIEPHEKAALKSWWENLDFEVQKRKKIKINSDIKKCTCYSTEINTIDLIELHDIVKDICEDNVYIQLLDELRIIRSEPMLIGMRNRITENPIDKIIINFYEYKGKIVRIVLTCSDTAVKIDLMGKTIPWSDTVVAIKNPSESYEPIFQFKYTKVENNENYTIKVMNEEEAVMNLSYNIKKGNYCFETGPTYFDSRLEIEGALREDESAKVFELNKLMIDGHQEEFRINSTIKAECEFNALPEDELEFSNINVHYLIDLLSGNEVFFDDVPEDIDAPGDLSSTCTNENTENEQTNIYYDIIPDWYIVNSVAVKGNEICFSREGAVDFYGEEPLYVEHYVYGEDGRGLCSHRSFYFFEKEESASRFANELNSFANDGKNNFGMKKGDSQYYSIHNILVEEILPPYYNHFPDSVQDVIYGFSDYYNIIHI